MRQRKERKNTRKGQGEEDKAFKEEKCGVKRGKRRLNESEINRNIKKKEAKYSLNRK